MIKKLFPYLLCIPLIYSCGNKDETKETSKPKAIPEFAKDVEPFSLKTKAPNGKEHTITYFGIIEDDTKANLETKFIQQRIIDMSSYAEFELPNGLTLEFYKDTVTFMVHGSYNSDTMMIMSSYTFKNDYNVPKEASVRYYFNKEGAPYRDLHHIRTR
tara:strand:+ start:483 stop:956 length:474 start_codon:yes stop_codon:yes gene_type:complete